MKILDFNNIYNFFILLSIFFSFLVIVSKNPMHSIIFLIAVFLNVFFILLLQDLEYLSIVFLIVYVGAVAILFLFVIYMLNISTIELTELN
jgi:NADH:ubiquinone oxidoreductase subunit 6 (subunit J)